MILDKYTLLEEWLQVSGPWEYALERDGEGEAAANLANLRKRTRALAAEQPESPQQAVPAGCVECMQEASEVLSEERMPRGPLADELWGFSLMLRDNAAQATQQAVLGAYTRCAEICNVKSHRIYDEYGSTDQETGERTIPTRFMDTVEACDDCAEAILAARDALKDKL